MSSIADLPAILGGIPTFESTVPVSSTTLPSFDMVEAQYRDIFSTGMVTNWKYVREYEEQAAEYLEVKHAVAVSNATAGLLLALKCLDLKGEIIVPSFTFSVTGHAISWNGLKPVFVDINPETCLIDPEQIEAAITPNTSAIMGVHIWGNPCPADQLQQIADRHNLPLLFDAAQAIGSRYQEVPVGRLGRIEVFSCSPTKVVTSAEGGLVTTNDDQLAQKIRVGRNYGDDGSYDCAFEGINGRMSELHAVIGLKSLGMAEKSIARRHQLIETYKTRLGQLPGIDFPRITPGGTSNGVYFSIIVDRTQFGIDRDQLYHALKEEHIDTRRYYSPPLHLQTANAHLAREYHGKLPHTEDIAVSALTLPLSFHMTDQQVNGVCDAILRLHHNHEEVQLRWSDLEQQAAK